MVAAGMYAPSERQKWLHANATDSRERTLATNWVPVPVHTFNNHEDVVGCTQLRFTCAGT
jgi:hypothetical protein